MEGRLEAIWIKRAHGGPMDPADSASMIADAGIRGNANQGGRRQVTIIEKEVFDELRERFSPDVRPVMRRANLMVSGVRLRDSREGVLSVGACRILIQGETRPCHIMDQAIPGLREALDPEWRGGVYGIVLDDGEVRVGDRVTLTLE